MSFSHLFFLFVKLLEKGPFFSSLFVAVMGYVCGGFVLVASAFSFFSLLSFSFASAPFTCPNKFNVPF